MSIEFVHVVSNSCQICFNFDALIVDGTVDVLAKDVHSYTALAVHAFVP